MSYYWNIWCLVFVTITIANSGISKAFNQPDFKNSYKLDSSNYLEPVSHSSKVINLTDSVYKCALRFLRCCAIPNNTHDIALLDPLVFIRDKLVDRQTIRLNGVINGTVFDLSQIEINYVNVILPSAYAKFIGNLPRLSISGTYNVTGSMAKTLPIFGSGPYSIELSNISLAVTVKLGLYSNGSFYMSKFDVEFSPKYIEVILGDILGGGPLGALVQDFIQNSAPQILSRSRLLIQEDLKKTVFAAANRRLVELNSTNDLLKFIIVFGNVTNVC